MNRLSAMFLSFFFIFQGVLSPGNLIAYEDTVVVESMQTIECTLTNIDTDKKRVTARWLADELLYKYQDIVLDVPDSCVITKNGETIELDDLEQNDPASVRFDENAQPIARASSITVTE